MKRAPKSKSKYEGSLKDFLLASGKQMDIKSESMKQLDTKLAKAPKETKTEPKAQNERSDNVGAKHAKLLIRLVKSCSEGTVSKVVTSMTEEQLDVMTQVLESCPVEMTDKVVHIISTFKRISLFSALMIALLKSLFLCKKKTLKKVLKIAL